MRLIRLSAAPDCRHPEDGVPPTLFTGDGPAFFADATDGERLGPLEGDALYAPDGPLADRLALVVRPRRVIVLIHGFEFEPRVGLIRKVPPFASPNPHVALFHGREFPGGPGCHREHRTRATPWLNRLATGPDDLVVCYAYASDPGAVSVDFPEGGLRAHWRRATMMKEIDGDRVNLFGHAYRRAPVWAEGLAAVIAHLAEQTDAPIHILGHSLGARVAMSALEKLAARGLAAGRVRRALFLAAALMPKEARDALAMLRAVGETTEFFNMTSRIDFVLRRIGAPLGSARARRGESPLGHILRGIFRPPEIAGVHGAPEGLDDPRWLDIRLDAAKTHAWADANGMWLKGDYIRCPMDHWVHYTHPGNWDLYNRLLDPEAPLGMQAIRDGIAGVTPRPASDAQAG